MSTSEHRKDLRRRNERRHHDLRDTLTASLNMDPAVKKTWLKALRSGEYRQGPNTMCSVDRKGAYSFCCIGVLADGAFDTDWHPLEYSGCHTLGPGGPIGALGICNLEKLGLSTFAQTALTRANDAGLRFSTIADAIEECL